mgnify:CR=1 FL=1
MWRDYYQKYWSCEKTYFGDTVYTGRAEGEYLAVIQHESNRLVYTKIVLWFLLMKYPYDLVDMYKNYTKIGTTYLTIVQFRDYS